MVYQHRTLRIGAEDLRFALEGYVQFGAAIAAIDYVVGDEAWHALRQERFLESERIVVLEADEARRRV